jgi:hypothetical protein
MKLKIFLEMSMSKEDIKKSDNYLKLLKKQIHDDYQFSEEELELRKLNKLEDWVMDKTIETNGNIIYHFTNPVLEQHVLKYPELIKDIKNIKILVITIREIWNENTRKNWDCYVNRIHFFLGLPITLRKLGLAEGFYKKIISDLGWITSDKGANPKAQKIWKKLWVNSDYWVLTGKKSICAIDKSRFTNLTDPITLEKINQLKNWINSINDQITPDSELIETPIWDMIKKG